jgi:thioredoxin reductase (NADPH)
MNRCMIFQETPALALGWGCCMCRTYNGDQRPACKQCGHARCWVAVLDASDFDSTVAQGTVIVDFWAPWCGPCKAFAPVFQRSASENRDVVFATVNIVDAPDLAAVYEVRSVPTILVFRDGFLVHRGAGALQHSALKKLIEDVKSIDMDAARRQLP